MISILAQAAPISPTPWFQIVTGILAIPTAILGFLFTISQVQRNRAETAKILRELSESKQPIAPPEAPTPATSPVSNADQYSRLQRIVEHADTVLTTFRKTTFFTAFILFMFACGAATAPNRNDISNDYPSLFWSAIGFISFIVLIDYFSLRAFAHEHQRLKKALSEQPQ